MKAISINFQGFSTRPAPALRAFPGRVAFHSIHRSDGTSRAKCNAQRCAARVVVVGVLLQWEPSLFSRDSFHRSSRAFSCSVHIRPVLKVPRLAPAWIANISALVRGDAAIAFARDDSILLPRLSLATGSSKASNESSNCVGTRQPAIR